MKNPFTYIIVLVVGLIIAFTSVDQKFNKKEINAIGGGNNEN